VLWIYGQLAFSLVAVLVIVQHVCAGSAVERVLPPCERTRCACFYAGAVQQECNLVEWACTGWREAPHGMGLHCWLCLTHRGRTSKTVQRKRVTVNVCCCKHPWPPGVTVFTLFLRLLLALRARSKP
jgi:hypothetical protein